MNVLPSVSSLPSRLILGIDPGLNSTGWGLLSSQAHILTYHASGLIKTSSKDQLAKRLVHIFEEINSLLEKTKPEHVAIEEIFVNKNPESSLKLSMARGVILCAIARLDIPVISYSANHVKKALVGFGHAEKSQVAWAVQQILKLESPPLKDASDALGVAICHAHTRTNFSFS